MHVHRPLVVVIEHVDMPEFEHAALAALAALDGYDIQIIRPVCPRMARDRVYATAVRRADQSVCESDLCACARDCTVQ